MLLSFVNASVSKLVGRGDDAAPFWFYILDVSY